MQILKKRVLGYKLLNKKKKIKMENASEFVALLVVNTILRFNVLSTIFTLFISLLINKFTWIMIWENVTFLIIFFAPTFIDIMISIVFERMFISDYIYNRNMMELLDFYKFVITILEGLSISFYRFIMGVSFLIIGLIRFDKVLIPSWFNIIIRLDSMPNSFKSLIFIYHYFSHPIKETFTNYILRGHSGRQMSKAQKILWKTHFIKRFFMSNKKAYKKKISLNSGQYQKSITRK